MRVIKFNKAKHFKDLVLMLSARNAYVPTSGETPKHGYIAYLGKTPVAAGFIRRVEGGYGQLDGLTSNPECISSERNVALDRVVSALIEKAKSLNISGLTAASKDEGTLERSIKHGFVQLPLTYIAVNLK